MTGQTSQHRSKVSAGNERTTVPLPGLQVPESSADAEHQCEEEREETKRDSMDRERKVREEQDRRQEKREMQSRPGQTRDDGQSKLKGEEELKTEKDQELDERTKTESGRDDLEVREEVEEAARRRRQTGSASVERSIQVLDGHIPLGRVQWKAKPAVTVPVYRKQILSYNWSAKFVLLISLLSSEISICSRAMTPSGPPDRPLTLPALSAAMTFRSQTR